jgi:hypothetical protein
MRYAIVLLLLSVLVGCGGRTPDARELTAQLTAAAPAVLGAADAVRAEVSGATRDGAAQVRLFGAGVRPDPNLVLDPVTLTLRNVRVDAAGVVQVGSASFSARVSEAAINNYVRAQGRATNGNVRNVRIAFYPGRVQVTGTATVAAADVPFSTTGPLRITDGLRVEYDPQHVKVVGIPIPSLIKGLLASRINPLVDLSGLRFTPRIYRVTVVAGALQIDGSAELHLPPAR